MLEIQVQMAGSSAPVAIDRYNFLVGRHSSCNLVLDDASVSKMHCVLLHRGNQVLVTDLGSRTGTIVQGTRLHLAETAPLQHGDQIQVGESRFTISITDVASRQPSYCQPEYLEDLPFPFVRIDGRKRNHADEDSVNVLDDPYDTVEPESSESVMSCAQIDFSTGASTIITEDELNSVSGSDSDSDSYSTIEVPKVDGGSGIRRESIRSRALRERRNATKLAKRSPEK